MMLPSVQLLLEEREEARELADDVATMLDHVLRRHAEAELELDDVQKAEQLLQAWHERSWRVAA